MRNPVFFTKFRRDLKKMQQRGYDMEKLKKTMRWLLEETPLPPQHRDHALKGVWNGYRDLHVEPDWLLIYKLSGENCIFARTGTHADIFSL